MTASAAYQIDVLLIADFRSADRAGLQAIRMSKALESAGYKIAILPWIGSSKVDPHPFLDWLKPFHLITPETSVKCGMALISDLRLFRHRSRDRLNLDTDQRLALVPRKAANDLEEFRSTLEHCEECLGGEITLAPTAPQIRANLELFLRPSNAIVTPDWPCIAPLRSSKYQKSPKRATPALGVVCRGETVELPRSKLVDTCLLNPKLPLIEDAPRTQVFRKDADDVSNFYRAITHLTTTAKADENPWPEDVLEALRRGIIPVLPVDFKPSFGNSVLYTETDDLNDVIIDSFRRPNQMEEMKAAGEELLELMSPKSFVKRVENLIGAPMASLSISSSALMRTKQTIVCLTTNGVGMGHLTRQMAIAKRQNSDIETVFLGFSQAVHIVRKFGWLSEHLSYHNAPNINTEYWSTWLHEALADACQFYQAKALVLDANFPFTGVLALRQSRPDLPLIWMRRAMWGAGRDLDAIEMSPMFDAVIEPGEIAQTYDDGPTTDDLENTHRIAPVTLLHAEELLPRREAAADLGLSPDGCNVIVLPGALNNVDATRIWTKAAKELGAQGASVVVGKWAISDDDFGWPSFVIEKQGFPFSKYFRAFDFAVTGAGYNSFTEMARFGLPAIYIPNTHVSMDRQDLRALYAERHGFGLLNLPSDYHAIARNVARMMVPGTLKGMRRKLADLKMANGAEQAARLIASYAQSGYSPNARSWRAHGEQDFIEQEEVDPEDTLLLPEEARNEEQSLEEVDEPLL